MILFSGRGKLAAMPVGGAVAAAATPAAADAGGAAPAAEAKKGVKFFKKKRFLNYCFVSLSIYIKYTYIIFFCRREEKRRI